jgi:hypothetical protein
MTSVVRETCPRCGTLVREGEAFRYEDTEAIIAEDVATIDSWLTREQTGLGFDYEQIRDREAQGEYLWRATGSPLAGCPANWAIEVSYATKSPGVTAARVVCTEPESLDVETIRRVTSVFCPDGLQPYGTRKSGSRVEGDHAETRWGGEQYLNTSTLEPGLLDCVLKRLVAAMWDALSNRNQQGRASS